VPAGKTDNGLPKGFQLVAPPFEEAILFRTARAYEKEKTLGFQKKFWVLSQFKSSLISRHILVCLT